MNPDLQSLPLRDIHMPDPVSWWPLAPGWWLLAGLLVFTVLAVVIVGKVRRRRRLINDALRRFDDLLISYQQQHNAQRFLHDLSILLRQLSISAYPVEDVAGLTGEQWLAFLDNTRKTKAGTINFNSSIGRHLITAPYKKVVKITADEVEKLAIAAKGWIKNLPAGSPAAAQGGH